MKRIIALLLTVLMVTSTASVGVSVVNADESHTTEIMTDVPEPTQDETEKETDSTEETTGHSVETEATEETEPPEETTEEPTEEYPDFPRGPETTEKIIGDINDDGHINISDVTMIQNIIAGFLASDRTVWGDTNGDGILQISDATDVQKYIASGKGIVGIEEKTGVYDPEMGKVTNVVSDSYTKTEINLNWDAVEGADGYEIFAYNYLGGYLKIGESKENSYTIITEPATGYSVSVRAYREENGKTYIGNFSDGINVLSAPNVPVFENVLRVGDGSFAVKAQADKYGLVITAEGQTIGTIKSNTAYVPKEYDGVQVAIENRFIYGDKSTSTKGEYFVLEGEMPLLTAGISVDGTKVTISWEKIEGVSGYEVFKMNADGEYVSICDTQASAFTENANYGSKNLYSVKYYVIADGERQYYSENLLEAVVAPKAESNITLWTEEKATPNVNSELDYKLESSNTNIVSVDGKEIKAVSKGTAQIKVLGDWKEEVIINVTVRQAPKTLTLSTYNMVILETEGLTIRAAVDSGAESKITFTSSDPSKATVDQNGFVIAYKAGTVTVTAETENGIKAQCKVEIYPVDLRTFATTGKVMSSAAWDSAQITTLSKGSQAFVLESKGAWLRIRYGGNTGWVYNKSFNTSIKNYSTIDKSTLPVIIDDWIFDNGKDIRTIYNYVTRKISYRNLGNDTVENLCVHVLRYGTGACYHYGALLYYMLDRAGYDACIVDGIDLYTGGGPHRWNMVKVNGYWYHIDATPIIGLPEFYLVKDSAITGIFSWDRNKYPKTPA